jgi:hypothetical protein
MGTKTGIDIPGETTGIQNKDFKDSSSAPQGGNLLDLSFGQYDTYIFTLFKTFGSISFKIFPKAPFSSLP